MKKLLDLLKKYRDVLVYVIFGGLTTVVNYLVYLPCYNLAGMSATLSNVLAWIAAVAFAYVTNKPFVFRSHDWSMQTVGPELAKFIGCRLGSGLLETGLIVLTVDLLHWNGNWMKLILSVVVVILNYVSSKLLVFRKK